MTPLTLWLIAAALLVGLEMFSGTFYLLAIAVGLLGGALAASLGLSVTVQIAIAAVVSLIAVAGLRRWKRQHQPQQSNTNALDLGHTVTVVQWIDANRARVRYRGSDWDAELVQPAEPDRQSYYIVGQRGNTLLLDIDPPQP
ncbi:hypothetical protein JHS3_06600 [Jeongeupia sp. HS-3]|uniref:NfeD family protein n=1 Tax=Jeongeupia sp. HS-3 TaxID=1009682 RepID=UPI0018A632BD|nr:NfeD family protein [Jeongeupia sp. HS-3]BCL74924.1 hypothetical protein JHS3_06600 [Jeongeupia sp. HS-3]